MSYSLGNWVHGCLVRLHFCNVAKIDNCVPVPLSPPKIKVGDFDACVSTLDRVSTGTILVRACKIRVSVSH